MKDNTKVEILVDGCDDCHFILRGSSDVFCKARSMKGRSIDYSVRSGNRPCPEWCPMKDDGRIVVRLSAKGDA